MNRPFFTVIVVTFNPGDKLKDTLESVLSQEFDDYEIIIKDAVSTDGSMETVPADPRIRLISRKDQGIYDGMNEGIEAAAGEYIYFLNCGDRLHDNKVLGKVYEAAGEDETAPSGKRILYGDVIEMKTGQHVAANPNMTPFAMFRYLPSHQACFYSRDLFEKRKFNITYRVRADYEHFLWSVMEEGARAEAMPVIIADYEGGGFSETKENRQVSAEEHRQITEKYFTGKQLFLYRSYLVLTLQPLRQKLAENPVTAAVYDRIKNMVYHRA